MSKSPCSTSNDALHFSWRGSSPVLCPCQPRGLRSEVGTRQGGLQTAVAVPTRGEVAWYPVLSSQAVSSGLNRPPEFRRCGLNREGGVARVSVNIEISPGRLQFSPMKGDSAEGNDL
ncbi:hypothetical protein Bbelb_338820 [Branchiostoma belcheri]|nr:hypothetical protein Bbelb_338820 [Branchiostoma belcheri]